MCPSCKVMIVRSEGCKFMECGKCRFQFCWNCLEEFYTEQHMYYSTCPLRIVMIYAVIALACVTLFVKLCFTFPILGEFIGSTFMTGFTQLLTFGLTVLLIASGKKAFTYYRTRDLQEKQTSIILLGTFILVSIFTWFCLGRWIPEVPSQVLHYLPIHLVIVVSKQIYSHFFEKEETV